MRRRLAEDREAAALREPVDAALERGHHVALLALDVLVVEARPVAALEVDRLEDLRAQLRGQRDLRDHAERETEREADRYRDRLRAQQLVELERLRDHLAVGEHEQRVAGAEV